MASIISRAGDFKAIPLDSMCLLLAEGLNRSRGNGCQLTGNCLVVGVEFLKLRILQ
jgi:hypothetical protein